MEPPNGFVDITQAFLGIKLSTLFAGFLGALTKIFLTGGSWKETFTAVFVGLLVVKYFTVPITLSQADWPWVLKDMNLPEGTIGYVLGMTAMSLCIGLIRTTKMWSNNPTSMGKP